MLRRRTRIDFEREIEGLTVAEQAVAFLALLELRKRGEIGLSQAAPFAPIRIVRSEQDSAASGERRAASSLRSA